MRKNLTLLLLLSFLLSFVPTLAAGAALSPVTAFAGDNPHDAASAVPAPPKTTVNEVKELLYGTEIVDSYRWLEDQNSPETRAWIDAQNAYTDSLIAKFPGRDAVRQQVGSLIRIDTMSSPVVTSNRYFFSKRRADQDQSSLFMRKGLDGKDELLIDPLPLSPNHTMTVGLISITEDGKQLAYFVRQGGADEVIPHLFDVDARKELPDVFPKARYSGFSILNDKSGVYLTRDTAEGPRVFFHKIGTETASDTEIFGKGYGPEKIIGSSVTEDDHYLQITVSHGSAADHTELYVKDLVHNGPIVTIVKDFPAVFFGQIAGDRMFVRTNWKAPKWRILEVDLKNPFIIQNKEKWREVVPEGEGVLDGFSAVGGKLAVHVTQNVVPHLKVLDANGKLVREVPAPALGSISGLGGRWNSSETFFSFTSYHMPPTIYRYDLSTGKQTVWSEAKVPIESAKYEVKQVWYTSKDGTKIPMFLTHAKGLKLDGSNPLLLTGYGGFNLSSTPGFNPFAAAWLANGGVYAVANLRGGGEFGEDWHHAGMLEKKQNVFDDFIAAAEWLIQNKYTSPAKLAIRGTSNGGLLVGAALTQRPDLFAAVICGYPLLDMVRYQNFLVAKYWVPEYGSSDNAEQFKYIYAYSPYHRVKAGTKYPSVLLISGDSDTRVAPLHARKMTALLQAATASIDHPILLHYDTAAGHSGGTPAGKQIENTTDELSYLFWQLGVGAQAMAEAPKPAGGESASAAQPASGKRDKH
ncbi:MAG TPA: prolyl oligopeptidase family serine peptidase [Candidatus Angelobacter sp.]|nr:prolyl oligopeptidase family serine peptidase [Candidatus Angelobacter sp.]